MTSAVVTLARHAHGDQRIADTMEGLALTLNRVEALMHLLASAAHDDQEATR